MAVNHADGMMFVSIVFYPIAAAKAAESVEAGWLAVALVPAALAAGVAVTWLGRKVIYATLQAGLVRMEVLPGWARQPIGGLLFLFYALMPFAIAGAGIYGTWLGCAWLAGRLT